MGTGGSRTSRGRGTGGEADAIEKKCVRRVGHGVHPELIELAVRDAVERREPRR
jgi:hypothetical protein